MHHKLLGVRIDDIGTLEFENTVTAWLDSGEPHTIVTPNPEFILHAQKSRAFLDLLNEAELSLPDGVGIRFAISALTDKHLLHRHTGVDTVFMLAKLCQKNKKKLFLFGGKSGAGAKTAETLKAQFPKLAVDFYDPGQINGNEHDVNIPSSAREFINKSMPVVLVVGLGQGKQEKFISQALKDADFVRVAIGVGGAFELIGGTKSRAPLIMRKTGFEWVWRLLIEPSRAKRIFSAVISFPALVIWSTLKQRRFLKAVVNTVPEIIRQVFLNRQ